MFYVVRARDIGRAPAAAPHFGPKRHKNTAHCTNFEFEATAAQHQNVKRRSQHGQTQRAAGGKQANPFFASCKSTYIMRKNPLLPSHFRKDVAQRVTPQVTRPVCQW